MTDGPDCRTAAWADGHRCRVQAEVVELIGLEPTTSILEQPTLFDVKSGVEYAPHMNTIQVVIEEDLLRSADRVARRLKVNRSALIRDALRGHLQRLRTADLERREREAYERTPDDPAEFAAWDGVAAWPEK
jgi:Arc/MetJ-type ribon-helix-helix transcriptional regulator